MQLIPENSVLNNAQIESLAKLDHQSRNYLLRTQLASHADIEAQFIMSDDDARPLKHISIRRYLDEDRYHRYYFHDLRTWNNNRTEFDAGQLSTLAVLDYYDLPTLSYASHMPQIIDRALFLESAEYFKPHSSIHPLCEWASYFNFAATKQADRFHRPTPYTTLCWPEHPLAWKQYVPQSGFLFENYTPGCYKHNSPFAGLDSTGKELEQIINGNIEKIIRWQKHSIACFHPEQGQSLLKYINPRTWVNKLFKHMEK